MPPTNNATDEPAYCLTAFGPDPGYCNPEPEPAACDENTPAEELCRDEADMPPNEDTGTKEEEEEEQEQDEQDTDDGLSDWVAPTDDETEQEEEFDNDVEPEEEEEVSEESEAETSEDEGGE